MKAKKIHVMNASGLHLRPAGALCQKTMKYKSQIMILYKNKEINAKSVLSVMASGIKFGDEIEVVCAGEDEDVALEETCRFIETGLED